MKPHFYCFLSHLRWTCLYTAASFKFSAKWLICHQMSPNVKCHQSHQKSGPRSPKHHHAFLPLKVGPRVQTEKQRGRGEGGRMAICSQVFWSIWQTGYPNAPRGCGKLSSWDIVWINVKSELENKNEWWLTQSFKDTSIFGSGFSLEQIISPFGASFSSLTN